MASEEFCRLVVDNLNTAVLLFDGDMRLDFMNPAAEMALGVSDRKALGQQAGQLLPEGSNLIRYLNEVQKSGHPITEREMRCHLSDGSEVTVDCTVTPVTTSVGTSALLVELEQVDRLLRISREGDLLARSQVTRALVRGMAHEIKNPLGGIRGAAQLLERELVDTELREYTRIIIGEADRLRNLVDKMLGPNIVPQKSDVDVHEVLERVRRLVLAEAGDELYIVRDYDPSIPRLQIDADQIIQAVLNIVRNAVTAIDGQGTIVLRSRVERHFTIGSKFHRLVARLEVIDDGPGIPEELRENIFYPMVTGRAEGTGLGLSIAQSLVNQHDGLIECDSEPGKTRFTIFLPLETS